MIKCKYAKYIVVLDVLTTKNNHKSKSCFFFYFIESDLTLSTKFINVCRVGQKKSSVSLIKET